MLKLCTKCNRGYPPTSEYFYKDSKTKDGLNSWCRICHLSHSKKWQKENPEKVKNMQLRSKFGVSLEWYNITLEKQNHCCAICGKNEKEFKNKLYVDHNHETGEIRGLLCVNCNAGLGSFKESTWALNKAIQYLYKNAKK